jgi:ABC-type bacteriocin/lantibiotic exporter with double-glycine peptidase domain
MCWGFEPRTAHAVQKFNVQGSKGSPLQATVAQLPNGDAHITVSHLTMAYGSFILMRDLNFTINHGDVFIIMGGSGCGKSTLLRHLIGLNEPAQGNIY